MGACGGALPVGQPPAPLFSGIMMFGFFGYHAWLVSRNITSNESFKWSDAKVCVCEQAGACGRARPCMRSLSCFCVWRRSELAATNCIASPPCQGVLGQTIVTAQSSSRGIVCLRMAPCDCPAVGVRGSRQSCRASRVYSAAVWGSLPHGTLRAPRVTGWMHQGVAWGRGQGDAGKGDEGEF